MNNYIELEEGWSKMIQPNIDTMVHVVWNNSTEHKLDNKTYMTIFSAVYTMCEQEPPHNYSNQLYERYKQTVEQVFKDNVIPHLDIDHESGITSPIKKQWSLFCIFIKWMKSFFSYLDRFHTKRHGLPGLQETGYAVFKDYLRQHLSEEIISEFIWIEKPNWQMNASPPHFV